MSMGTDSKNGARANVIKSRNGWVSIVRLIVFIKSIEEIISVVWAGERTRDCLISFIFSFHQFTAEPQRLP
jgi:hypothetical protein